MNLLQMSESPSTLYYIQDPMCSWCWGFAPVWKELREKLQQLSCLQDTLTVQTVLGGLAKDTDEPMPASMQISIRNNWRKIQQDIPGRVFNFDFWTQCQPRRSTYPACRSVIACGMQRPELKEKMISTIQQAYYQEAKNPSDDSVLIKLAVAIGLDEKKFTIDLNSNECHQIFKNDLLLSKKLRVSSFPSLVLLRQSSDNTHSIIDIPVNYNNSDLILKKIEQELRT